MDRSAQQNTRDARISAISDSPLDHLRDDALGFAPYVRGLTELVRDQRTSTPLTISIEGPWGSGKSTFLNFLGEQLDHELDTVVRFDAWRHETSSSLLADFALEFIRQLRQSRSPFLRAYGSARLWLARFDWYESIPAVMALLLYLTAFVVIFVADRQILSAGYAKNEELTRMIMKSGSLAASVLLLFLATKATTESIGKLRIGAFLSFSRKAGYAENSAFSERAVHDIERIINAWGNKRRIYVIVDDLDRCTPEGAANLVHALSILTSIKSRNLVFFVGMDRRIVVASIAMQLSALAPYTNRLDDTDTRRRDQVLSLAHEYLDKFITIPFRLPRLEEKDVIQLLIDYNASTADPYKNRELRHVPIRESGSDSEDFRKAVKAVAFIFEGSPRSLKRFVNMLRLSDLLIDYLPEAQKRPTILQLAKFVAITTAWPVLADELSSEQASLASLEILANGRSDGKKHTVESQWLVDRKLTKLMQIDIDNAGSMIDVSLRVLFWSSRARTNPSDVFNETGSRAYWNKTSREYFR